MGNQETSGYKRLVSAEEKVQRPKRQMVKKFNGKLKGLRLSSSRKLNWKPFSAVLLPRKIARICTQIVKRMMKMDYNIGNNSNGFCPDFVLSCHWGFPVLLSNPSVHLRKNVISFDRKTLVFAK